MKRTAFFFCSLFSLPGFGQTDSTRRDTVNLLPVEVRATRAGATAPFTKTNVTRAFLEKGNLGPDLPILLNQTPSVVVHSDAGNGVGYTGLRIRGTDATRINVTLNGIPYNDAESQGTFFVDLPDFASSINNIQIQRGVGTSSNGPGAFGASINISTNEWNEKAYLEANNSYGSFNTLKNTLRAGTGLLGGHFTADLRLSRLSSDGYIERASSDLKSYYFTTAYRSGGTGLRLNLFSGDERTYQAWNGVSEADLPINRRANSAGTAKPGSPYENETDNYRQDHYQFFFDQKLTPRLTFATALFLTKGKGYYEQYRADARYSGYNLPNAGRTDLVRQLWLDNDYYGSTFSLQYLAPGTEITLGGARTRYDGRHFGEVIWAANGLPVPRHRWYDLDSKKDDFNIYGKWQQNLSTRLQVFTDLQYRSVRHDINGFRDNPSLMTDNTYDFFNPKLGVSYLMRNGHAYLSYSVGSKEPNRDDFEAGLNQQPLPERLYDWEAGLEQKGKTWSWGGAVYFMNYKNQLVLTGRINDVGAYTRTNIDRSYRAGVELQGSVALYSWLQASANLTLSRNKVLHFSEFLDDYDNGGQKVNTYERPDLAFSPEVVSSGTLTVLPAKGVSLDLLFKQVGKQYLDNTGNEARKLDAYSTLDLRLAYSFQKARLRNVQLIALLNNVTNKLYEPNGYTFSYYAGNRLNTENYYFPMAGINGMFGVNIKL